MGGRICRSEDLDLEAIYPIVLDPKNHVTKLLNLIQLCAIQDHKECSPSFVRNTGFWGSQLIKKIQRSCLECRKWKGVPSVPRMADLPVSRLHLYKPLFWSTGMDCFGPLTIKVGRQHEKR